MVVKNLLTEGNVCNGVAERSKVPAFGHLFYFEFFACFLSLHSATPIQMKSIMTLIVINIKSNKL